MSTPRLDSLQQLKDVKALSKDGLNWLTLALDPFHDVARMPAGYPDADSSQTIVACYKYRYQLAKPSSVTTGTWDAHVCLRPVSVAQQCLMGTLDTQGDFVQGTPVSETAPLTIYAAATGSALYPTSTDVPVLNSGLPGVGVDDLCTGMTRIVGLGFEVENTTAEIYKQGTCTAYRMPTSLGTFSNTVYNAAKTFVTHFDGEAFISPPSSADDAMLLKGSLTWKAAEGAYVVGSQSTVVNPLSMLTRHGWLSASAMNPSVAELGEYSTSVTNTAPTPSIVTPQLQKTTPYNTAGIFLTGLSLESTFTITLKVYVERAPTQHEPDLCVLASPSASYDVMALELYAKALQSLPVAVPVRFNKAGDWWKNVLRAVSTVAMPFAKALLPWLPGGTLIGATVKAGADTALRLSDSSKKKRRERKKEKAKEVPNPQKKKESA